MKLRFALLLMLLLPPLAHAADPVAGVDYVEIPDGRPFAPAKGKVEVAEVFAYSCVHCFHFESQIREWARRQPAHVKFTAVPAVFGGYWTSYARAYYAAESLGVLDQTHDAVYRALHVSGTLPVQNVSHAEIASFYGTLGVDSRRFAAAMQGKQVEAKIERAKRFAVGAGVEGTPTLVVAGKYRVTARSLDEAWKTIDYLVARERAAAR